MLNLWLCRWQCSKWLIYLHRHEIVALRGDRKETEMQEKAPVISCQWISLLSLQQVLCGCRKSSLSMREQSCPKYLLESISRNIKKQVKNKQTKKSKPLNALKSLIVLLTVNWLWKFSLGCTILSEKVSTASEGILQLVKRNLFLWYLCSCAYMCLLKVMLFKLICHMNLTAKMCYWGFHALAGL